MDRRNKRLFCRAAQILAAALTLTSRATPATRAPVTPRDDVRETLHGTEIADPYRWLEDQNSPETRLWIDRQNRYRESVLGALPARAYLQRRLAEW